MKKHKQGEANDNKLRNRAETELKRNKGKAALPATETQKARILHELQVHQIELEMQNDELRHAKEEIDAYVDELETIYHHTPAIILLVDKQRRVRKANEIAASFSGRPPEELPGTRCGEALQCLHARDNPQGCGFGPFCQQCAISRAISNTIETGKAYHQEEMTLFVPPKKNPVEHILLLSCAQLKIREAPMALVTLLDISQRKLAEEERERLAMQLRQSEKLTAIGQLAGGIAHNFNNQLGGIMGNADILHSRLQEPELQRFADNIIAASHRAADLTRQILSFARKGKNDSVPVDLHAIIEETIAILQNSIDKRIKFYRHLDAECSTVIGDPSQFQNVFLNLGLNARDAMPEGGELLFATATVELDPVKARELDIEPGYYIRTTVSDTGSGLSQEVLRHLFEPFFTTKEVGKGTGLGLADAHGTILGNRGTITGRNRKRRGTAFTIYLPLVDKVTISSTSPPETVMIKGKVRVLLVDDESIVRDVCSEMLRDMGCEVTECIDGVEAVAHYRKCWQEIDLVILDVVMPLMRGRDVFIAMQKINPEVNVLVSSGYSIDEEAEAILKNGAHSFLQKPYTITKLSQKVAEALRYSDECTLPDRLSVQQTQEAI
ncbi:MAG: hybrid sensor histidine kinase/response regulator [Planctomycetota bacterium]|jgi:signal transduction histidine kinase/ActR/RegA family two-component response regulator